MLYRAQTFLTNQIIHTLVSGFEAKQFRRCVQNNNKIPKCCRFLYGATFLDKFTFFILF